MDMSEVAQNYTPTSLNLESVGRLATLVADKDFSTDSTSLFSVDRSQVPR